MHKFSLSQLVGVAAIALMSAQPSFAADSKTDSTGKVMTSAGSAAPAATVNSTMPKNLKDNAYVTISGKVGKVLGENAFELNYASGVIKVTTDEAWKPLYDSKSAYMLKPGQKVTVTGSVENGWFAHKEIQAYAIDVEGMGGETYSYNRDATGHMKAGNGAPVAQGQSGDMQPYMITATQFIGDDADVRLVGEVSKLEGDDFWLRYNGGAMKVDAGGIDIPKGSLSVGDKVVVVGKVDDHFFTEKDIDATSITRINMYERRVETK